MGLAENGHFVENTPNASHNNNVEGAVLDNLKMGYEKDNEEEPLKSL